MCALGLLLEIKKSNTNLPQHCEDKIKTKCSTVFPVNNWYQYKMDHLDN